jgi:hypothetical protein
LIVIVSLGSVGVAVFEYFETFYDRAC